MKNKQIFFKGCFFSTLFIATFLSKKVNPSLYRKTYLVADMPSVCNIEEHIFEALKYGK